MKPEKIMKITILTTLLMGVSLGEFCNPVFAGIVEDMEYSEKFTELIDKGDLSSAEPLIEKIKDETLKKNLLVGLTTSYIKKGELISEEPLLDKIEDKDLKQSMLVGLATASIKKGEFSSVEALLEKIEDKTFKDTLAAAAMRGCLEKGEIKKASEFLLHVEDENILTAGFLGILSEYWSEKGFLGTSWFVLRFTFSGKIFQIKW